MTDTRVPAGTRRGHGLAAVLLLALSAAGCSGDAEEDPPPPSPAPVVLTTPPDWAFYPEALVTGELSMTDTGCLLVNDLLVVWPSGTAWDASAEALTFAEVPGASVSAGGRFEGGGGSIPMRVWRGRLEPEIVTALEGCLDDTGASSAVFAYPET